MPDTRLVLIGVILVIAGTIAFLLIDKLIWDLRLAGALKIALIAVAIGILIWLR